MTVQTRARHDVPGMGTVYDYRDTGLLPANGGRITLEGHVHHIPVMRDQKGADDFIALANVLKVQGLSLQFATDGEGNVCLYNPANVLCFQARGVNSRACGTEHMHLTIGQKWTERQFRAAAWLEWWLERNYGIPNRNAILVPNGFHQARFKRTGHTTHAEEARVAGFNDRTDPGPGFVRRHVHELADFYKAHRTFKHAPTLG